MTEVTAEPGVPRIDQPRGRLVVLMLAALGLAILAAALLAGGDESSAVSADESGLLAASVRVSMEDEEVCFASRLVERSVCGRAEETFVVSLGDLDGTVSLAWYPGTVSPTGCTANSFESLCGIVSNVTEPEGSVVVLPVPPQTEAGLIATGQNSFVQLPHCGGGPGFCMKQADPETFDAGTGSEVLSWYGVHLDDQQSTLYLQAVTNDGSIVQHFADQGGVTRRS